MVVSTWRPAAEVKPCRECGARLPKNAGAWCPRCGAALSLDSESWRLSPGPVAIAAQVRGGRLRGFWGRRVAGPDTRAGRSRWAWCPAVVAVLVAVAAIGTGVYFAVRDSPSPEVVAVEQVQLFPIGVQQYLDASPDPTTLWGYIDATGATIIEPRFSDARTFSDGLAAVRSTGSSQSYGYIDASGSLVIEPRFQLASDFSEGLALVTEHGSWTYIDKSGAAVISLPEFVNARSFSEGLAPVALWDGAKALWGYLDPGGALVIEPQFGSAAEFSEGLAAVQTAKGWGYIDTGGKWVIEPQFGFAGPFCEGLAVVWKLGAGEALGTARHGYIDREGEWAIEPRFATAGDFHEGLAGVMGSDASQSGFGYIDATGAWAIEPRFYAGLDFSQGLAAVEVDYQWGFIDQTGAFVIEPRFRWADSFLPGGVARVGYAPASVTSATADAVGTSTSGYIDESGDVIFRFIDWGYAPM